MSKKKQHHEEHVDETWLIPYADMLTLLLALFIVMFAMSQMDKEKFQKVSEQFNIIFSGGSGNFNENGIAMIPPVSPYKETSNEEEKSSSTNGNGSNADIEDHKMNEIKELLEEEIQKAGYSDKIVLVLNKEGLDISIQDTVLFASGDAAVRQNISPILQLIAKTLMDTDNNIKIVGHTDNVPIKNSNFRSNWDLSAIRAINVMQFLVDKGGLPQSRFLIQGNGENSPKYDNSTEEGRARNRRVEIIIVRKYPAKGQQPEETLE